MTKSVALGLAAISLSILAAITFRPQIQPSEAPAAPEIILSVDAPEGSKHPNDTSSPAIGASDDAAPNASDEIPRSRVALNRTARSENQQFDVAKSIINHYGKIVSGLKVSAIDEQKAMDLLVDRAKVPYYVGEILTQEEKDNYAFFRQTIASAQAEIDREIRESFDPATAAKLQKLITARAHLPSIKEWFDPAMTAAGVPLEPEQMLPLLSLLHDTYVEESTRNMRYVVTNIDRATGLTALDLVALDRAKAILSLRQLAEFKDAIVKRNQVILQRQGGGP